MKLKFSICALLLIISVSIYAQNSPVIVKSLQGNYKGEMRKKLAHGNGIAKGIEEYKGEFRKGLPHGKGIYKYKDESVFEGYFKKGKRSGKGKLISIDSNGKKSIIEGYWKKDKYIGVNKNGKPYKIISLSNISRIDFRKNNFPGNEVYFKIVRNHSYGNINYVEFETTNGQEEPIDNYTKKIIIREFPCTIRATFSAMDKDGLISVRYETVISIDSPCNIEARLNY